jgi:hypothetical protein
VIDYLYLDDLKVIDDIEDSREMLEIIKLAKQFQLDCLFKACETHLKELLANMFEHQNGGILGGLAASFRQTNRKQEETK